MFFFFFTSVTNICTLPKELVLHFVRDLILLLNTSLKELTIDLIFHTGHEQLFPEWKEKVLCSFNPTVHPWPLPYAHFPLFIFLDPTLSFCSCSNYKRLPPDRKRKYGSYWPAFIYPPTWSFFSDDDRLGPATPHKPTNQYMTQSHVDWSIVIVYHQLTTSRVKIVIKDPTRLTICFLWQNIFFIKDDHPRDDEHFQIIPKRTWLMNSCQCIEPHEKTAIKPMKSIETTATSYQERQCDKSAFEA